MCFNKELSLILFIFGAACSIKFLLKQEILIGIFIFLISLIQLMEFFLHLYQNKQRYQSLFLLGIFIVLNIHIIFNTYVNYFIGHSYIMLILGIFYLIVSVIYLIFYIIPNYKKFDSKPKCPNNCRLSWSIYDNMNKPGYLIYFGIYLIAMLYAVNILVGPLYACVGFILFLLSVLYSKIYKEPVTGTIWCLSAIIIIIFVIIIEDPKSLVK